MTRRAKQWMMAAVAARLCGVASPARAQTQPQLSPAEIAAQIAAQMAVPAPPGGFDAAQWDLLRARTDALEADYTAGKLPLFAANQALLRFKIDQARVWLRYHDANVLLDPEGALHWLRVTLDRGDFVARAPGDAAQTPAPVPAVPFMEERAYFAPDGSAQPFWVCLPPGYSPLKTYPLVTLLHGYTSDVSKIAPWLPGPDFWAGATSRGMILVIPYGRRNSDFVNVGEDDTYAVRAEMERLYAVNRARESLFGVSMGGTGALVEAMHRPGAWTGVAAMSARSDLYLWAGLTREQVAPWQRPLYDADSPRFLAGNARGLPLLLVHGQADQVVPVAHARLLAADLRREGATFRYREAPGAPHTIYVDTAEIDPIWDWLAALPPLEVPRRVHFTTASLAQNRASWASIKAFETYGQSATLDAELKPGNRLDVTTHNVAALQFDIPAALLQPGRVTLRVNGAEAGVFDAGAPIRWPLVLDSRVAPPGAITFPGLKTPARCGPLKECLRAPFLLVYGTQNGADDEASARRFAREWEEFADGMPRLKADTQVTDADKQGFNLVLFGTRASNAVLRDISDRLPLELLDANRVRVGTQVKTFEAPGGVGVQFCYPAPWSAARSVVVQSGVVWGGDLPVNHKLDLVPDYMVYSGEISPLDSTNRALLAGWFSGNWSLTPDGAPAKAAGAPPMPPA